MDVRERAEHVKQKNDTLFRRMSMGFPRWEPTCDCELADILLGSYVRAPRCVECNSVYKRVPSDEHSG
jgi:hypothetical protein